MYASLLSPTDRLRQNGFDLLPVIKQDREQTVLFLAGDRELPAWSKQISARSRHYLAVSVGDGWREASPTSSIAVFILSAASSLTDSDAELISRLRRLGYKVICCQDGVSRQSVEIQCAPLLAGALKLLDSAGPDFADELNHCLNQLLRAEAEQWQQQNQIQTLMQQHGIVGESRAMQKSFRLLMKYAGLSDLPVLITGATGTGKELFARAIHQQDARRRGKPFIAVNCAAISDALAESELFGHRRGAFTGAENNRPGLFRAAADGVLFLDEISELSPASQARLLRVIQEKKVLSLGTDRETNIEARVIAATNCNLAEMVREEKFRADLYHRLNVLPLFLPPLSERPEDLRPLTEHLLRKWQALNPETTVSVTDSFITALARLDFPGNVRELENLIRQVLINKCDSAPFDLCDLPPEVLRRLSVVSDESHRISVSASDSGPTLETALSSMISSQRLSIDEALKHCECLLLKSALEITGGNQTRAASLLGITPRSVYNKMRQHNLQPYQVGVQP